MAPSSKLETVKWNIAEIAALAREHDVRYEVAHACEMVNGVRTEVGYDVTLAGTYSQAESGPGAMPGCPRCERVWKDMEAIASSVIPRDPTDSTYRIALFDHSWHFDDAALKGGPVRVELVIQIRNRTSGLAEVIDCETRCCDRIVRALTALGVRHH